MLEVVSTGSSTIILYATKDGCDEYLEETTDVVLGVEFAMN